MTKIDLSAAPYFDDYNKDKKYYKVLFRPGRAVQARELNQIQSVLQEQVARLGTSLFHQGSQILPADAQAVRYFTNSVFAKIPAADFFESNDSGLLTDILDVYWVGKTVTNSVGVKGTIQGYKVSENYNSTTKSGWVRLYIQLLEAAPGDVSQNNFLPGDTLSVDVKNDSGAVVTTRDAKIYTKSQSALPVGRIGRVTIQDGSVFFFNDYFILVDGQTLFVEPRNLEDDAQWTTAQTYEIGLDVVHSVVTFEDDPTLLDNAAGTPNYSAPGADRLRVEAILTKNDPGTTKQSYIKLLSISGGLIENFWHGKKVDFNAIEVALARRTYDESGNYTVTPFLAEPVPFIDDGSGNRGLYTEGELSPGWSTTENNDNESEAKVKAIEIARDVFELSSIGNPVVGPNDDAGVPAGVNRYYPGTSYDDPNDPTSFKNLCKGRIGIKVDPGKAYVKGYEQQKIGITKTSIKKSQSADYKPGVSINTPLGDYILVTNVFGAPVIDQYAHVELYSSILNVDENGVPNQGNPPSTSDLIGSARMLALEFDSGAAGSATAVYKLYIFDLKLNDGKKYTDIKSIASQADGTFLANLSLKDSANTPSVIFTGTVSRVSSFSPSLAETDSPSTEPTIIKAQPSGTQEYLVFVFDSEAKREQASDSLTVGTAVSLTWSPTIAGENTTFLVTAAEQIDDSEHTFTIVDESAKYVSSTGSVSVFSVSHAIDTTTPVSYTVKVNGTPTVSGFSISGSSITFSSALTSSDSVVVSYSYNTNYTLKVTLSAPIPSTKVVSAVKTVKKIRGSGTLWRSNPGEKIEKGDYVSVGSGSTKRVYKVFSTPSNDNELNVDLVSGAGDVSDVDSKGKFVNAPWEDGAKMVYLIPEGIKSDGGSNAGLVFRLPHPFTKTLRGGEKGAPNTAIKPTTYFTKRVETTQVDVGEVTFSLEANESAVPFSSTSYALIDDSTGFWFTLYDYVDGASRVGEMNPSDRASFSAEVQVTTNTITFYTGNSSSGRKFTAIFPVNKQTDAAKESSKSIASSSITTTDATGNKKISLAKADVFRITKLVCETSPGVEKDVLLDYMLDTGQTDYYYGISSLILRPGRTVPKGKITAEFDYFEHSPTGDYFSIDSYPWTGAAPGMSYDEVPDYISKKNGKYDLVSCLDFRPVVDREENGKLIFKKHNETPLDYLACSYHVYESRKDLLYINKDGDIKVKYGEPGLASETPLEPQDSMVLYNIEVLPYTATHQHALLKMADNRRYTMRDIGKLEGRIKTLEYYTSLSLLEKDTKDLVIKDALGQDKFKHGFLTDNFENPSVSDTGNTNFQAAIDSIRGELKPKVVISNIGLIETAGQDTSPNIKRQQNNYTVSDNIFTLQYTNTTYMEQPLCSRVINVNPYAVQNFIGSLKLSPSSDTWRETAVSTPLIVQDSSAYETALANFNKDGERIDWGPTQTEWTGIEVGEPQRVRPSNKSDQSVVSAGHEFPARDGNYRDAQGNLINGTGIPKTGQLVRVPKGYANAGSLVPYNHAGQVQFRTEAEIKQSGYQYQIGIKKKIDDLGFSAPVSYGKKIVNSAAAEFIRSREIFFEGRNFLPNTRLYAFFDDKDVTQYCFPEIGFGERDVPETTLSGFPKTHPLKFELNAISSSTDSVVSGNNGLANLKYSDIDVNTSPLKDAVLTGLVTLDSNTSAGTSTLKGTNSKLSALSLSNITLNLGDLLTGASSGAEGVVAVVPGAGETVIEYTTKNGVAFQVGEIVRVTNRLDIDVRGEVCPETIDSTNRVFTIQHLPIGDKSRSSFNVYIREYDGSGTLQTSQVVPKANYTLVGKTITLSSAPLAAGAPNVKKVEVDYEYPGSNYTIEDEEASRTSSTVFTLAHDLIENTIPVSVKQRLSDGTTAEAPSNSWSVTYPNTITFNSSIANDVTVLVSYKTPVQTFSTNVLSGTTVASSEGTLFKTELVKGSVVVFKDNVGIEAVVDEVPNSNTEVKVKTITDTIATATKAADKLEALQIKYTGKYVDITGSSNKTRNILDKKIVKVSYDPQPSTSTQKFRLELDASVMMDPTSTTEQDSGTSNGGLSITIKSTSTSENTKKQTPKLKCNASGTIKGRFVIPDPKVEDGLKFRTGERVFRLTNSQTNETAATVSLADAPYTARGWIETEQDTLVSTRQFRISEESVIGNKKAVSISDKLSGWGKVCPRDPVAQSFTVKEKTGIFLTAVDVFFYSKDSSLPVTLQIRPLDDGGTPSNRLLYEQTLESSEVVINKVDLTANTLTVVGATQNAIVGFNRGPWNINQNSGLYNVTTGNFASGKSTATIPESTPINLSQQLVGTELPGNLVPTRFVLKYPVYLTGNNSNYCFVLLTDSVPAGGAESGPALEDTYQVYFAQTGKVEGHNLRSSPVHRKTPLAEGEDEINFILGTETQIENIPGSDGVLFKSGNGISWEVDQRADLKYALHKAVFDVNESAEIEFVNESLGFPLGYTQLETDPVQTIKGSSRIRVKHPNHNIPVGSKVQFIIEATDTNLNLNGLARQVLEDSEGHAIVTASLDSYVVDLGETNLATASGNVGGGTFYASKHIRFEEVTLISDPVVLPGTEIRWRISPTTGATPFDTSAEAYKSLGDFAMELKAEVPFPASMQVASSLNEKTFLAGTDNPLKKSLRLYATLSSTDANISPMLDAERLSLATKAVRIDNPVGLGATSKNINDDEFDVFVCLPNTEDASAKVEKIPGGANGLFFSDTDNILTGSSFVETNVPVDAQGNPLPSRTISGVGSLFTVELKVGDTIKHPDTNESRKVAEILSDTVFNLNEPFSTTFGTSKILLYNPPPLKIKTKNALLAKHLSKLDVGKYLSISGTQVTDTTGSIGNFRDFSDALVLDVLYTPEATAVDPQLGAPCLCQITVDHFLPQNIQAGFEGVTSSTTDVVISQRDNYVDEIAAENSSALPSVASKYICKPLVLGKPANTLKVMFDGCRPTGCELDLYYKTSTQNNSTPLRSLSWTKLEYSVESNGALTFATPAENASLESFSAYEANALQLSPFTIAQVKIVLRGENPALYPKIRNLRVLALEE